MFYEPLFKKMIEDILKSVEKDNIQGIEMRSCFGLLIDKSGKLMTLDEELAYYEEI